MKDEVIPPRPHPEVEERINVISAEICAEITNLQHSYSCRDLRGAKNHFIKAAKLFRSLATALVIPTYAHATHVLSTLTPQPSTAR